MGWKETDERLIKRGELILDLSFHEHYKEELETLNAEARVLEERIAENVVNLLAGE